MDQKRLMLAIAMSVAILLGFQLLMPKRPAPVQVAGTTELSAPKSPDPMLMLAFPVKL